MEQRLSTSDRRSNLYETLIHIYPPAYLNAHREELLQNFEDLERDIGPGYVLWSFVARDLFTSLAQQYVRYIKRHRWAQWFLAAVMFVCILCAWQIALLRIAHSSFEKYAAFRGCETITSQTDNSGTCVLPSGETVSMVLFRGRWYLQGDLPMCLDGICL